MVNSAPVSEPRPPASEATPVPRAGPETAPPGGSPPVGPPAQSLGMIARTALELYRRRAFPLLLVATAFLVPSAVLGVLQQRADEERDVPASEAAPPAPAPASGAASPTVPAGPPGPGAAAQAPAAEAPTGPAPASLGPAPASPGPAPSPPGPAPAATPAPGSVEPAGSGLPSARELAVRGVWTLIGGLFTTMLAAAVAREGALAVTGREPQPGRSVGYGLAHVLGLALLGLLAAAWTLLFLLVAFPLFFVLSVLQRSVPGLGTALSLAAAVPLALVFVALVSLSIPVYVVEGRRGLAAVLRVWELSRGELRHVAAAVLLILLVGLVASGAAMGLALATGASLLAVLLTGIVAAPLEGLLAFVLYLDLRTRRGRFGVASLQAELARNAP